MTMATWKTKQLRQQGKASRTNGKDKGRSCKATQMQKGFAKRNRSYKWPDYDVWLLMKNGTKGGSGIRV